MSDETAEIWEGCGSVAYSELFAPIERPAKVTIDAIDNEGKPFTLTAEGLLGRVILHEYDHLQGKVFAFHIKDLTRIMSKGEYIKRIAKKRSAKKDEK